MNNDIYANTKELWDTLVRCKAEHLTEYLRIYDHLDITIFKNDELVLRILDLETSHELLTVEEEVNMGFGKQARVYRMMWRDACRGIKKHMKKRIRGAKLYNREWSKERKVYISNLTGECHSGLWWTIRACIDCPQMIKYGFAKENK